MGKPTIQDGIDLMNRGCTAYLESLRKMTTSLTKACEAVNDLNKELSNFGKKRSESKK